MGGDSKRWGEKVSLCFLFQWEGLYSILLYSPLHCAVCVGGERLSCKRRAIAEPDPVNQVDSVPVIENVRYHSIEKSDTTQTIPSIHPSNAMLMFVNKKAKEKRQWYLDRTSQTKKEGHPFL